MAAAKQRLKSYTRDKRQSIDHNWKLLCLRVMMAVDLLLVMTQNHKSRQWIFKLVHERWQEIATTKETRIWCIGVMQWLVENYDISDRRGFGCVDSVLHLGIL